MLDKIKKTKLISKEEKNKWIIVALLSLILIFVFYYNIILSKSGDKTLRIQEQKVEAVDHSIPSIHKNELIPSLPSLNKKDETKKNVVPLMIQDIFSFAPRSDSQGKNTMGLSMEKKVFILKGTIIDGKNSVAFINDQVLGIGGKISGFTVVRISDTKAVIRNEKEEITVLLEDETDETF